MTFLGGRTLFFGLGYVGMNGLWHFMDGTINKIACYDICVSYLVFTTGNIYLISPISFCIALLNLLRSKSPTSWRASGVSLYISEPRIYSQHEFKRQLENAYFVSVVAEMQRSAIEGRPIEL